jgi:hypothetical protein
VTVPRKAALSLLISVVLVAGFVVAVSAGFFKPLESRFFPQGMKYLPSAAIFLALFLIIFFLFNLRQDSIPIVSNLIFEAAEELEELTAAWYPMSLVYTSFTRGNDNPHELEAVTDDLPVIEEREGVNYIDRRVFAPDRETEQSLDPAFKSLIDSVIRRR